MFRAYDDIGMRANVSGHVINRPFFETIPYLEESLPDRLKQKFLASAADARRLHGLLRGGGRALP